MYLLFKSDIVQTLCEKTDEGEEESTIFILVLSSFLSVKSLLKIWANHFSLLTFEGFEPSLSEQKW